MPDDLADACPHTKATLKGWHAHEPHESRKSWKRRVAQTMKDCPECRKARGA